MTSMEREEKEKVKKREKKLEDEETLQQATWVKYTIPIKHQVKQQRLLSVIRLLLWPQTRFYIIVIYSRGSPRLKFVLKFQQLFVSNASS